MKGHTSFVNSVDCSRGSKPLVVSGGDDCQVKLSEYLDSRNPFNPKHCRSKFGTGVAGNLCQV